MHKEVRSRMICRHTFVTHVLCAYASMWCTCIQYNTEFVSCIYICKRCDSTRPCIGWLGLPFFSTRYGRSEAKLRISYTCRDVLCLTGKREQTYLRLSFPLSTSFSIISKPMMLPVTVYGYFFFFFHFEILDSNSNKSLLNFLVAKWNC